MRPERTPAVAAAVTASEIGLEWFVRLRWWAGVAQAVAIAGTTAAGSALPLAPMLALAALTLLSNAALVWLRKRSALDSSLVLGAFLVFDLALLTGLLALSGGPANPFSIIYLVNVCLATILLSARWAWTTVLLSIACFGLLFAIVPPSAHVHPGTSQFGTHLWGMFLAFTASAVLVAYFVTRVTGALRNEEVELARAQERVSRSERIASVLALAAGTAHEMGTPLATIALAAKELEREASRWAQGNRILDEARLIRHEVERCRDLLEQLGSQAGDLAGELPAPVDFETMLAQLRAALPGSLAGRLHSQVAEGAQRVMVPHRAFVQVLGNLVRNAFEASAPEAPVELEAGRRGPMLHIEVRDRGRGMSEELLARAREPFFTTKQPGGGLGLGLFLVDRFAAQLQGSLSIASRPEVGTTVILEIPA